MAMTTPVSSIRNLGPASELEFARAGIADAETLIALGPDQAYAQLLQSGAKPQFIGYYALVMGLQGRPWNDCQGEEKDRLRKRFDQIKAAVQNPQSGIEHILNQIGVISKQK